MCLLLNTVCVTHKDTQSYRDAVQAWRLKDLLLMSERAVYYHFSAEASTAVAAVSASVSQTVLTTLNTHADRDRCELLSSTVQYRMRQGHLCHRSQTLNTCHLEKHRLCCLCGVACI